MIRQHHSQCERVKVTSTEEKITEQFHAPSLEIKNMVKSGAMHFTEAKPMYGDFTDLPDLDKICLNRLRINQVHANLAPNVRKHLRTPDEMIDFLKSDPDHDDLVSVGLAKPKPKPVEIPSPQTEPPAGENS